MRVDIQSQKLVYRISTDILKMVYKRTWSLSISDGPCFLKLSTSTNLEILVSKDRFFKYVLRNVGFSTYQGLQMDFPPYIYIFNSPPLHFFGILMNILFNQILPQREDYNRNLLKSLP